MSLHSYFLVNSLKVTSEMLVDVDLNMVVSGSSVLTVFPAI